MKDMHRLSVLNMCDNLIVLLFDLMVINLDDLVETRYGLEAEHYRRKHDEHQRLKRKR